MAQTKRHRMLGQRTPRRPLSAHRERILICCIAAGLACACLGGGCTNSAAPNGKDSVTLTIHANMRLLTCRTVVTNASPMSVYVYHYEESGLAVNGAVTLSMKVRDETGRIVSTVDGVPTWWTGDMTMHGPRAATVIPRRLYPDERIVDTYDLATVFAHDLNDLFKSSPIAEELSLRQWLHEKWVKVKCEVTYDDLPVDPSSIRLPKHCAAETEWMLVP